MGSKPCARRGGSSRFCRSLPFPAAGRSVRRIIWGLRRLSGRRPSCRNRFDRRRWSRWWGDCLRPERPGRKAKRRLAVRAFSPGFDPDHIKLNFLYLYYDSQERPAAAPRARHCNCNGRNTSMPSHWISLLKDNSGATAIEYGLIAALIAVAAIAAFQLVGTNLSSTFHNIATQL